MRTRLKRSARCDSGSAAVSFVLIMPALFMLLELMVLGARVTAVKGHLNSASREAARSASLARTWDEAQATAEIQVLAAFSRSVNLCPDPTIQFDDSTQYQAGGQVGVVVSCTVLLDDLGFLSMPGTLTMESSFAEPIDQFRQVEP